MIICVYGTTGELIKLAPVLARLRSRGADVQTWCTGQQASELTTMADALGVPQADLWIAEGFRGRPLSHPRHLPSWVITMVARFTLRHWRSTRRELARKPGPHLVVVHGDTFTTVAGALIGRVLGVPVAHIEAGLRSHDWRNPFPEEINRRIAARLAHYHFAPGKVAVANIASASGTLVDTGMNTVRDSLDMVPDDVTSLPPGLPSRYGIVSLHRFELLQDRSLFTDTLKLLAARSAQTPFVFIDHPVTARKITEYGLDALFDDFSFLRVHKLSYFEFVNLVRHSEFAVTDSGGLQEECFYLDHPCLVHRAKTERGEGIGANAVLSGLDLSALERFLDDPSRYRTDHRPEGPSPSDIIVEYLASQGFCP